MRVKRRYVDSVFASVRVLMIGVFPRSCDFCGRLESELARRVARARRRSLETAGGEVGDGSRDGRIADVVTTDVDADAEYCGSDDGGRGHQGKEEGGTGVEKKNEERRYTCKSERN